MAGRQLVNLGRTPKLPGPPTAAGLPEPANAGPLSTIRNAVISTSGRAPTIEEIIMGHRS